MISIGMAKFDLEECLLPKQPIERERIEAVSLFARSGAVELAWLALDFMDFNLNFINTVKMAICEKTGIEIPHIHIVTTHNHGGGTPDIKMLAEAAAKCVLAAKNSARPAYIKYAFTEPEKQINYRRRKFVPEIGGVTCMFYGASEKTEFDASPHIEHVLRCLREGRIEYALEDATTREYDPFERTDSEVVAIQFSDESGETIGSVVRFAAHAVCCNLPGIFSSDYPWHVRHNMEKALGGVSMFFNGPCADISPGIVKKGDGMVTLIGGRISEAALKALARESLMPVQEIRDETVPVRLKVGKEVIAGKVDVPDEIPDDLPGLFRYWETKRFESAIPFLREKYLDGESEPKDDIAIKLGFLKINDLIIAAYPGETFSGTGVALKKAFPSVNICTVTEHDRTVMYMPPLEEYKLGGYESTCMVTSPGAESTLRRAAITEMKRFLNTDK